MQGVAALGVTGWKAVVAFSVACFTYAYIQKKKIEKNLSKKET